MHTHTQRRGRGKEAKNSWRGNRAGAILGVRKDGGGGERLLMRQSMTSMLSSGTWSSVRAKYVSICEEMEGVNDFTTRRLLMCLCTGKVACLRRIVIAE